jgi:hypothetical protein
MNSFPSPRELAQEALQVLEENPMTSEEHFEFLVREGIIDRNGKVLVQKLFGEDDGQIADSPILHSPDPRKGEQQQSP